MIHTFLYILMNISWVVAILKAEIWQNWHFRLHDAYKSPWEGQAFIHKKFRISEKTRIGIYVFMMHTFSYIFMNNCRGEEEQSVIQKFNINKKESKTGISAFILHAFS